MDIMLNLTVQEINYILSVLASRPYSEVSEIIPKIQNQAIPQSKHDNS